MAKDREGNRIAVGDTVGFKSDIEQEGEVTEIKGDELTVCNDQGFGGDYLRYDTKAWILARECHLVE